tara:strand:+ start:194 stop:430 length:237 start_codon:yes stop_codon:yes gene_type:complete
MFSGLMSNWQYINSNIDIFYNGGIDAFSLDSRQIHYILSNWYPSDDGKFADALDQNLFVINKNNVIASEGITITSGDA